MARRRQWYRRCSRRRGIFYWRLFIAFLILDCFVLLRAIFHSGGPARWIVAAGVVIWTGLKRQGQQALVRSDILEIDNMSGLEFERFLEAFFDYRGYRVRRTAASGDFGADLVITDPQGQVAVQAKRWKGPVGVQAIQEVVAAKSHYGCNRAIVVTNSSFTQSAQEIARSNEVQLWGRQRLITELSKGNIKPVPIWFNKEIL